MPPSQVSALRPRRLPALPWYHGPWSLVNMTNVFPSIPLFLIACRTAPTLQSTSITISAYAPATMRFRLADGAKADVRRRIRQVEKEGRDTRAVDVADRLGWVKSQVRVSVLDSSCITWKSFLHQRQRGTARCCGECRRIGRSLDGSAGIGAIQPMCWTFPRTWSNSRPLSRFVTGYVSRERQPGCGGRIAEHA